MASKLIILFVVLFAAQCSQAKEERSLLTIVGGVVSAANQIATSVNAAVANVTTQTAAINKAAFDKAVADIKQEFSTFLNNTLTALSAGIEQAKNYSAQIDKKLNDGAQNLSSSFQAANEKALATIKNWTDAAKQRGANVDSCLSSFSSNWSSIANTSESNYQTCSGPYVGPVLSTTSQLSGLGAQSYQASVETLQAFTWYAAYLNIAGAVGALQNGTNFQANISSLAAGYVKDVIPQSILAEGAILSCAASSLMKAVDPFAGAVSSAIECVQNA